MALHSDEPAYFLLALSDGQRYFSTQQSATIGLASDRPDSAKLTLPAEFPRTAAEIRFKESAFEIVNRSYQHIVVDGAVAALAVRKSRG